MSFLNQKSFNSSRMNTHSNENHNTLIQNTFNNAKGKFNLKYDTLIKKIAESCNIDTQPEANYRLMTTPSNDLDSSYKNTLQSSLRRSQKNTTGNDTFMRDLLGKTKLSLLTGRDLVSSQSTNNPRLRSQSNTKYPGTSSMNENSSFNTNVPMSSRGFSTMTKPIRYGGMDKNEEMKGIKKLLRNKKFEFGSSLFDNRMKKKENDEKRHNNYFNSSSKNLFIERMKDKFPEYTVQKDNRMSFINTESKVKSSSRKKTSTHVNPKLEQLRNRLNKLL